MYKFLEKFLRLGLYAVPLTALIVVPGTMFPFIFGRVLIFQILIELLATVWLILLFKRGMEIKKTAIFYAVIAFWAVNLLATIFSVNASVSFWGKAMRMDGWLFLSHLLLWFLLMVSEFKDEKKWLNFWKITAAVGGLISTVGILQFFFSVWPGLMAQSGRVFSFLGNPIFYSNYILFFCFMAVYLLWKSKKPTEKVLWAGLVFLNLAALYLGKTRGAFWGLIFGVIVFGLVLLSTQRRSKKIKFFGLAAVAAGAVIFLSLLFLPRFIDLNRSPILSKLSDFSRASFTTRFIGAEIAWKGIAERPLLGWGPSNFDLIFDKYYNPESLKLSFAETVWDKPHNYFLEMGTAAGFLGIAAYLAIYGAAIFIIFRAKKNGTIDDFTAALFSGLLAAKFISVLSSFETPDTLIILFAFFAYLNSFLADSGETKSRKAPAALSMILILAAGYFIVINSKNLSAGRAIARANDALYLDQIEWRESVLEILGEPSPYQDELVNLTVIDLAAWEGRNSYIDEMLAPTLKPLTEYLAAAEKRNPRAYIYPFELAQVLGMRGDYLSEPEAYPLALAALDRAIRISPSRQSIYLVKGKIYLTRGEQEKAIAILREAVNLYPAAREPHWFLGLALAGGGNLRDGLTELELGKSIGELKPSEALYLISLYNQEKMYEKIVPIYQNLIERYPRNAAELWANLAATYLELKDKDKAAAAASQALTLDPSLRAGISGFMKKLEAMP